MTTQTEITKTNHIVQAPFKVDKSIWPLVLAALVILFLISAAVVILQPKGEVFTGNRRALEAISARYQGQADLYAATKLADSQRALEAISARYQGLADLYTATKLADSQRALEAISARYQGQADMYLTQGE